MTNAPARGLRLSGLEATKAFSDNATHCLRLTTPEEVDGELKKWLKAAYDARQ